MNPLIESMLMSLVRKALVVVGTYIVATGVFSETEWLNYAAGLAPMLVGAGWSLWNKYRASQGA
jgi:hypothetical protein